jgi:SAM-dependent methyltransferase
MSPSPYTEIFQNAVLTGHFLKCTLSKPGPAAPPDLTNVYLRPVEIKGGRKVAFTYRYKTRDEVRNFSPEEAAGRLEQMLGTQFLNADLFTPDADHTLSFDKTGVARLKTKKPSHAGARPDLGHDRQKQRRLDPAAPWLHALGITSGRGEVLAASQDKWRQINKYLEIIESLLRANPLPSDARIADMGSGKGYLTFALYDFLTNKMGLQPHITGIELRPHLVDFCNKTAREAGFTGLEFLAADIDAFRPDRLDMLIALHACDTATDLALAKGVRESARIIVAAPCCHKQVRRDMAAQNEMAPLLRHGILEERQAEILTDGIRALLLEANGYKTQVFEFVSSEHTAKNVMITAVDSGRPAHGADDGRRRQALGQVEKLKAGFGIREHYLERLL